MSRRNKQRKSKCPADEECRPGKRSYVRKMGDRAKVVGSLSETLIKEPKAFPKKTAHAVRPWFRKMWKSRGGGLYAFGFVLTFVYLEISLLIGEVMAATGFVDFFTEQLVELPLRFLGESLGNLIQAFIWPVPIATYSPPWGAVILGAIYLIFTYLIKEPLEQWLFNDKE